MHCDDCRWEGFFFSQELNGMLLSRTALQPLILTGTELELWIAVVSRLRLVTGSYQATAWNLFYPVLLTLLKKYDMGGRIFQPVLVSGDALD
jgi:hypothetical protein